MDEVFAGMKPKEIEGTIKLTFNNTFKELEYLCQVIKEDQTKPELEIYDAGAFTIWTTC